MPSCGAQNLFRLGRRQILTAAPSSPRFFTHRVRFGDDARHARASVKIMSCQNKKDTVKVSFLFCQGQKDSKRNRSTFEYFYIITFLLKCP